MSKHKLKLLYVMFLREIGIFVFRHFLNTVRKHSYEKQKIPAYIADINPRSRLEIKQADKILSGDAFNLIRARTLILALYILLLSPPGNYNAQYRQQ